MILLIGLGNPGIPYEHTPHNAGFMVLDALARHALAKKPWQNNYQSDYLEGTIADIQVILCKPQTFMNDSGQAVAQVLRYQSIETDHIWLVHDDLDVPMGTIRVDVARNSAGHKGVQSVIDALQTNAFWRLRIGVRPDPYPAAKEDIDRYLTHSPLSPEYRVKLTQAGAQLIIDLLTQGISKKDVIY